jgi:hypothetical protein
MPGRRIGQPGVDLAGEFVSALPGPLRAVQTLDVEAAESADHRHGQPVYQGPRARHVQHIVHSAAIGCGPQGQGRRVLGAAGRRETWGRRPAM